MPVMVKRDVSILFVHIPKCGGSSFEQSMAENGWRELLSIRGLHANQLRFMRCSLQHMHAELLDEIVDKEKFDKIITLVREPCSRLKSEYAWQISQKITNLKPEQWIDNVFNEFAKNPFVYDNHIRPQCEFIMNKSHIFKLEENGVTSALESINLDTPSNKNLKGMLRSFLLPKNVKMLKKTTKSQDIHEAFNQNTSQIQKFYEKDYDVLGYSKP